jgi:hypothetical protein
MIVTEGKIQQQIVMWFRNNYCTKLSVPRCAIFSVPNERNNKKEMMSMIQTGLMSGVSDLIVVLPSRVLFVEVKTDKGTQQPKQKEFEQIVTALGFEYIVVRSLQEFQKNIK